jgi:hypothetical protein
VHTFILRLNLSTITLASLLYFFAIVFLTGVIEFLKEENSQGQPSKLKELVEFLFGSMYVTMLNLILVISGGMNGVDLHVVLKEMHWSNRIVFPIYLVFTSLGVLNVVTILFVDSAPFILKSIWKRRIDKGSHLNWVSRWSFCLDPCTTPCWTGFLVISGGMNGIDLHVVLQEMHGSNKIVFPIYLVFMSLCVLNVVTILFVDSALLYSLRSWNIYSEVHGKTSGFLNKDPRGYKICSPRHSMRGEAFIAGHHKTLLYLGSRCLLLQAAAAHNVLVVFVLMPARSASFGFRYALPWGSLIWRSNPQVLTAAAVLRSLSWPKQQAANLAP